MLLKKDESGRKSRKVDELAGFELLILTGIISLILDGNYIAGYSPINISELINNLDEKSMGIHLTEGSRYLNWNSLFYLFAALVKNTQFVIYLDTLLELLEAT